MTRDSCCRQSVGELPLDPGIQEISPGKVCVGAIDLNSLGVPERIFKSRCHNYHVFVMKSMF